MNQQTLPQEMTYDKLEKFESCPFAKMGKKEMLEAMTEELYLKCQKCIFWNNCKYFERSVFTAWNKRIKR
jgi:hypothetical protein